MKKGQLKMKLRIVLALIVLGVIASSGMADTIGAESLIEDFKNGPFSSSARIFYDADSNSETIRQSDSTGFGWGGFSDGNTGDVKYHLSTSALTFMSGVRVPGSYAYTIFSTNGDGSATHHVTDLNIIIIDMRANGGGQDVGLLIKDGLGDWYLSTAATAITMNSNIVYTIDVSTLAWEQVENPAAADMDEMDSDNGPGTITTNPSSTTPDLSKVLGGGIYLHSVVNPENNTTRFNSIQFNYQLSAFDPDPVNGIVGMSPDVVLSWSAGDLAAEHDVYLGTDFNEVNEANDLLPVGDVYRGRQSGSSFNPNGLSYGQKYFWRIDEQPGSHKGAVWSFTTITLPDYSVSKYRGNNQRTGYVDANIPSSPVLLWTYHERQGPRHAWKEPGHEVQHIDFDYADQAAIGEGIVYFGSSGDHKVYALDANTGQTEWEFFTEGPVRFAPVVDGNNVFAASDDGYLYCLDANSGQLNWKFRGGPRGDKMIGNDYMISRWPGRSGVMVDGDKLYFAAGMWSRDGAYVYCLNSSDASIIWKNDTLNYHDMLMPHASGFGGMDPHGYMLLHRGLLYVTTGRGSPAAFDAATGEFVFYENGQGYKPHFEGGSWAMASGDLVYINRRINNTYREVSDPYDAEMDPMPGVHSGLMGIDYQTGELKMAMTCRERAVIPDGGEYMIMAGARAVDANEDPNEYIGSIISVDMAQLLAVAPMYEPKDVVDGNIPDPPSWVDFIGNWRNKLRLRAPSWFTPNTFKNWETDTGRVYNLMQAQNTIIACGRGKVTALDQQDGAILWTKQITGNARGLCIADGKIIVSSTDGYIYCYGQGDANSSIIEPPVAQSAVSAEVQTMVTDIIQDTGVVDGYALVLGAGDGTLVYELARQSNLVIYCIEPDPNKVSQARQILDAANLHGVRASIHQGDMSNLPYAPYFANLIVWDQSLGSDIGQFSAEELYRVLRPYGGIARQAGDATAQEQAAAASWLSAGGIPQQEISTAGQGIKIIRGELPGAGEWTHPHANIGKTSSSDDTIAKAPLGLLWIGGPGPGRILERHRRNPVPLFSNGILVVCGEHDVFAVDAYNGRELWNRRLPEVGYYPFPTDLYDIGSTEGGQIIADANYVYCVQGPNCLQLDLFTGQTERIFPTPTGADWQFLGISEQYLIGLEANSIFVYDTADANLLWQKTPDVNISPFSIVADATRIYYLDQPSAAAVASAERRGEMQILMSQSSSGLQACNLADGNQVWVTENIPLDRQNLILKDDHILVLPDYMQADHEPDGIAAYSTIDGALIWSNEDLLTTASWRGAPIISQTVVVGDTLYTHRTFDLKTGAEKFVTDPVTGEDRQHMFYGKNFCGAVSANEHLMFFRSASIGYVETKNSLDSHWLPGVRPGCWISVLPAGGIVMAPEGYSNCICSYSYKTSLALYPLARNENWSHSLAGSKKFPFPDTGIERVKHLRANLGAVGDQHTQNRKLWMAFPSPTSLTSHYVYRELPMTMTGQSNEYRYNADSLIINGSSKPWLYTSGIEGDFDLTATVSDSETHTYQVALHFAETAGLSAGERVFDVKIQGVKVLDDLDIADEAGGSNVALVKAFSGIEASGQMSIKLIAQSGAPPLLSAIEIREEPITNSPDINGDGNVNFKDYEILINNWLSPCLIPSWCISTDLDASGSVDWLDMKTFTQSWIGLP
jgi:outer membrane protein assembly factor BamB